MKNGEIEDLAMKMSDTGAFRPNKEDAISDDSIIEEVRKLKNLEATDRYGRTALSNAACYERTAVVEFLLNLGADVNTADKMGYTPLHFAVQKGNTAIAEMLLKHGADISAKDAWGNNSISQAKHTAPHELFELLLKYGADPTVKNNYGNSAIDRFAAYPDVLAVLNKR